jgi:hypothetical protein
MISTCHSRKHVSENHGDWLSGSVAKETWVLSQKPEK